MCSISKLEDNGIPTYASSLAVPNVQEMVMKNPLQVPKRYIRNEDELRRKVDISHLSSEIPVIDLSLLSKGNKDELMKLDSACKEWGFFQVVNHDVPSEVLQATKDASKEFFELPLEEKLKISMQAGDIQGYGHTYVASEEQILDWSDALMLLVHPSRFRRLQVWPTKPKHFKETIETYSRELKRVAEELICSLSLLLGMDKGSLLELHKELVQGLRVNYYPPCRMPKKVLGIRPHSDTSSVTILMQHDSVSGLQILHQEEWMTVTPIPNSLVVNLGDVVEILSNGKFKSVEHRAVTNESETRMSYATFFVPRDDMEIEPIGHTIDSQESLPMYKKVKYGEYLKSKYEGKRKCM